VEANPNVFQKMEKAPQKYSHWVAEISGQIGEKTSGGFVLKEIKIKIKPVDKKPREQKESGSPVPVSVD